MKIFASFVMAALLSACQSVQERPSSMPMLKKMLANGTTLTYLEQGTGPTVVFLHGAYSDHRIWEPQREAVARGYRFIALDLRYFGTAPWPDDGTHFTQATHVADVAAFIRELKVEPVHLVGRSYGATTALAVAIQHPQLVRSLFLNEPGIASAVTNPADQKIAAEDRKCMGAVGSAARAGNNAEATKLFFDCVNGQPGGFEAVPAAMRAMHLDNARTVPLQLNPASPIRMTCAQLSEINVPVEITKGELTRPYYQITVGAVYRCIPSSRLSTIKGGRHGSPSQQPAAFNEVLLAFLARH
jgi:pimeloyl-ACP methyl ester carboxylesterase